MQPDQSPRQTDRRNFIKTASVASALGAISLPRVHAQEGEGNTIQLALIGCGGRGTGAVADALSVQRAELKLVAMADVFEHRVDKSFQTLQDAFADSPDRVNVPPDQRFQGFDAYRKAMDVLRPGDIAIFATPLAFRELHFKYAIERGINVFMEKPIVADAPTGRRMLELAKLADSKNLKCAVGLMIRHCHGRLELHERIANGEIGDLIMMRAYRMHGQMSGYAKRKPAGRKEILWQISEFHSFLWSSGGIFSDFYIHQIDETCWMKNAWPVKAQALGGRHYRGESVDQNFDTYSVEYTFEDGTKLFFDGRNIPGCHNDFSSVVHGTKGSAIVSTSSHSPGKVRIFSGQRQNRRDVVWAYPQPEKNPYQLEWVDLVDAIIDDRSYNEVPRGVHASLVTSLGRMAAHTGQEITYKDFLDCPHEFAPNVANFTDDGPAPVMPDENGRYPVPMPGKLKDREYAIT